MISTNLQFPVYSVGVISYFSLTFHSVLWVVVVSSINTITFCLMYHVYNMTGSDISQDFLLESCKSQIRVLSFCHVIYCTIVADVHNCRQPAVYLPHRRLLPIGLRTIIFWRLLEYLPVRKYLACIIGSYSYQWHLLLDILLTVI